MRYDEELQARAREAIRPAYEQWVIEEALYGGGAGSFWFVPPTSMADRSVQYLSHRDWDIKIKTRDNKIVGYTIDKVERKEAPGGA